MFFLLFALISSETNGDGQEMAFKRMRAAAKQPGSSPNAAPVCTTTNAHHETNLIQYIHLSNLKNSRFEPTLVLPRLQGTDYQVSPKIGR